MAGGFPPTGSRKLMHKLRHLYSKHHVISSSDFVVVVVVVKTLEQKISSCAAKLRKHKTRLMRLWKKLFCQNVLFTVGEGQK